MYIFHMRFVRPRGGDRRWLISVSGTRLLWEGGQLSEDNLRRPRSRGRYTGDTLSIRLGVAHLSTPQRSVYTWFQDYNLG